MFSIFQIPMKEKEFQYQLTLQYLIMTNLIKIKDFN